MHPALSNIGMTLCRMLYPVSAQIAISSHAPARLQVEDGTPGRQTQWSLRTRARTSLRLKAAPKASSPNSPISGIGLAVFGSSAGPGPLFSATSTSAGGAVTASVFELLLLWASRP